MRDIAIIGGGLGGTACAYQLAQAGMRPVIFEAGDDIASGASGNPLAMVNPRLQKRRDAIGDFYMNAFLLARRRLHALQAAQEIGYRECGTLFLMTDDKLRERYTGACANFDPHGEIMACVDAVRASRIAGVDLDSDALWLSVSGCVCPEKLCRAMAQAVDIRLNTAVENIAPVGDGWRVEGEIFDAVILAAGPGVMRMAQTNWLPLSPVRGQLAGCSPGPVSERLACNLNYGGYCTPAFGDTHVLGASFEPGRADTGIDAGTTDELLAGLNGIAPALARDMHPCTARAALRVTAKDRRPVIGPVPDPQHWRAGAPIYHDGLYITAAYGSHGVVAAIAGAQMITDDLCYSPTAFSQASLDCVAPARFPERYARKGRM